ncbi:Chitin-binding type-2 domain-containing protein [Mycobacterium sp. smrl_JER01]
MLDSIRRPAAVAGLALAPLTALVLGSPGVAQAAECGVGTVYDAPTDTCVAAPVPPPPPPPPPPWNGDPTPGFSIGICAPIPFVSLCTGI